jgi:hypothetical protein
MMQREDFPNLTDEQFYAMNWQDRQVEGKCDRCYKIGIKCYHILFAEHYDINGNSNYEKELKSIFEDDRKSKIIKQATTSKNMKNIIMLLFLLLLRKLEMML